MAIKIKTASNSLVTFAVANVLKGVYYAVPYIDFTRHGVGPRTALTLSKFV